MLIQCLQCWPNIEPALGESLVICVPSTEDVNDQQTRDVRRMLVYSWLSVNNAGPALNQHWVKVS